MKSCYLQQHKVELGIMLRDIGQKEELTTVIYHVWNLRKMKK